MGMALIFYMNYRNLKRTRASDLTHNMDSMEIRFLTHLSDTYAKDTRVWGK